MPLPMPKLDNRTFDQLVTEGRALIPRYAPGWTDHNLHDPGMTLLDLFAWLTEMDIYQLDRTPEASYRAFLRLLGVELHAAQVAETVLAFSLEPPGNLIALPAGIQVGDAVGTVIFQTADSLNVSPARLVAVLTGHPDAATDQSTANQTPGLRYQPFGTQPEPEDAFSLGFDRPLATAPVPINLYVWVNPATSERDTRAQLIAESEAAREEGAKACPPGVVPDVPDWWQHYSVRTVWEYYTAAGAWAPLADVSDKTRGLTLSGPVRFLAPTDHAPSAPGTAQYFIRCRLLSGHYECPPEIAMVALNTVAARHAADIDTVELLGTSNGWAGQVLQVRHTPVVPGSTHLQVVSNGVPDTDWREVLYWDRIGPHDQAYLCAPEHGEVTFGDGRIGRVPPAGAEIRVKYQVGGGPEGNVAAGHLTQALSGTHNAALVPDWEMVRPTVHVAQPFPALGGALAEKLSDAQGRALAALAEPHRAVSLTDFEALAVATPGVPVARARALADYHPAVPCFPALGSITVVVVPRCSAPQPTPGPDMLRAVARYLERRRTLTTEVHVIGPCYTPVVVHARLHVEPHADVRTLRAQAQGALDAFFHPLTGGPDGTGWPVGRDVYRAEVMALLHALPGVAYVDQFGLQTDGDPEPRCANLPVCPDCLVASGQHQIQVMERSVIL